MAKQAKLIAEPRTALGRSAVRKLKASGSVPAIMYGSKDKPEALQVSKRDINALLSHAAGENILVELEIAGKSRLALVQEVQHAPLGGAVLAALVHASIRAPEVAITAAEAERALKAEEEDRIVRHRPEVQA